MDGFIFREFYIKCNFYNTNTAIDLCTLRFNSTQIENNILGILNKLRKTHAIGGKFECIVHNLMIARIYVSILGEFSIYDLIIFV